jgi:hypothetical protein
MLASPTNVPPASRRRSPTVASEEGTGTTWVDPHAIVRFRAAMSSLTENLTLSSIPDTSLVRGGVWTSGRALDASSERVPEDWGVSARPLHTLVLLLSQ